MNITLNSPQTVINQNNTNQINAQNDVKLNTFRRIELIILGIGLFTLSIGFTFGLALLSSKFQKNLASWYSECRTGFRKVTVINPTTTPTNPPSTTQSTQNLGNQNIGNQNIGNQNIGNQNIGNQNIGNQNIGNQNIGSQNIGNQNIGNQNIGNNLSPVLTPISSAEVIKFINKFRKDKNSVSLQELEKGLSAALNLGFNSKDPEHKTTLFAISEAIAQKYIDSGNFEKAYALRMQTAQAIAPAEIFANLHLNLSKVHPNLGLRLQPLDSSLFKNQALTIQKRDYGNNVSQIYAFAKLGHLARIQIQSTLTRINHNPIELFKALPAGFCKAVTVYKEDLIYHGRTDVGDKKFKGPFTLAYGNAFNSNSKQQVINFQGVGKVKIGIDPKCIAEYNKFSIELDSTVPDSQAAAKMSIILAALGLSAVTSNSRSEDIERIKVMQLLRAYYPQQAYTFEREAKSFDESVDSLKARIIAKVPDMKMKFNLYLQNDSKLMYQQEVFPGQNVWCVKGLAQETRKAGGVGLFAGVGNTFDTPEVASNRIVSILKLGALSSQDRFQNGITVHGASSEEDLNTGGGESVFVRIFTQKMENFDNFAFQGTMQLLYDLDLVERVGYNYADDKYGTKVPDNYKNRPNVINLAKEIETNPLAHKSNELCIRNRIGPQFIKAIKVQSENDKQVLITQMKAEGLVKINSQGLESFNDIPLNKFILVAATYTTKLWS